MIKRYNIYKIKGETSYLKVQREKKTKEEKRRKKRVKC